MKREHAEQPFLSDDRCRQHRAHAPLGELADVSERVIVERARLEDIGDGDGAPDPGTEVDHGQPSHVAERRDTVGIPLGRERRRLAGLAEPDEAPHGAHRRADLLQHGRERSVDIPARAELERDVRDQLLTLERVGECDRRARALEREAGLADEGLHPGQLVLVEHARVAHGAEDDADHLVSGANRDEDAALDLGDRVQAPIDDRRVLGVVDRERRSLTGGGVDSGRLAVERDPLPDQSGVVLSSLARRDEHGNASFVLDQRHVREVELEDSGELVEEQRRDVGGVGGVEQPLRETRAPRRWVVGRSGPALLPATSSQHARTHRRDGQRESREVEQRHRTDEYRLSLSVHRIPDDRDAHAALKDGPSGLLALAQPRNSVAALGDANRVRAGSIGKRPCRDDPPDVAGLFSRAW